MKTVAWSTASRSNGLIYQWSRWHIVYNLDHQTITLCGRVVPSKAKHLTGGKDSIITGGNCLVCKRERKFQFPPDPKPTPLDEKEFWEKMNDKFPQE